MNIGFFFEWIFDTFIVPGGQLLEFLQFGTPQWMTGVALIPLACFSLNFIIAMTLLKFFRLIRLV